MMLVAEGHWLRPADSGIGNIGRALNLHRHPAERGNHKDRAKNRGPGHGVGAAMKNLRHACVRASENSTKARWIPGLWTHDSYGVKERPTELFTPAMRTGDYKYFAHGCRALSLRGAENFLTVELC